MKLEEYYNTLTRDEKQSFIKNICNICNISDSRARHFVYGTEPVAGRHCVKISVLTNNKVTPYEMRNDIFPKIT